MSNEIPLKNWWWDPIKLILDEDLVWDSGKRGRNWKCADGFCEIIDGYCYIKKGKIWDGTTFVPDGPEDPNKPGYPVTWKASLIHDIGCAETYNINFPYSRDEIDVYFRKELVKCGFEHPSLYYRGVWAFTHTVFKARMWWKKI